MKITNIKEKQLIIARRVILLKINGDSYNINTVYDIWNNLFPKDFKMSDGNIPSIGTYIKDENITYRIIFPIDSRLNFTDEEKKQYSDTIIKSCKSVLNLLDNSGSTRKIDIKIKRLREKHKKYLIKLYKTKPLRYYIGAREESINSSCLIRYHSYINNEKIRGEYDEMMEYGKALRRKKNEEQRKKLIEKKRISDCCKS